MESSVRRSNPGIKQQEKSPVLNIRKNTDLNKKKEEMRDLYDRENKLLYWIKRAELYFEEPDKRDVQKLVQHLQDQGRASLWIIRYITALITMRKQITKSFKDVKENDIRIIIDWMDKKGYKVST